MPTNKLWIEHTERAAWESVEALREKLVDAEKRMQRMAPPVEGWRGVFDALERAREQHALSGAGYGEWLTSLLERLERAEARARTLEQDLSRARESGTTVASIPPADFSAARDSRPVYLDDEDDLEPPSVQSRSRGMSGFFSAMKRRYKAQLRDGARADLDGVVAAIEGKVDEFADLDEPELADAAVDLAVLALLLEREAKR